MDEMKISTKFTQGIITKILGKVINKKLGVKPEIEFNDPIRVSIDDTTAEIHLNVDLSITKEELMELLKDLV